ncbi:MAG: site-2 protease family protein [Isosphaeraceae bacterium]
METLSTVGNILKVVFGLGFVIFIHELGHFLVAKWNGVKVEKFSIGFGPTLLGMTRGETEYVIAAIPLGGFVKMLGEGLDEEANKSTDPRSFSNKSVGARMAIIAAGVIMNVLLGLGCFAIAYGRGMIEMPARVGGTVAGSPAYVAGMKVGDEIVSIDGKNDISWNGMKVKVSLSGQGQVLHFGVKRPGRNELVEMDIQPRREPGMDFPTIGILQPKSLDVPLIQLPAGMESPPAIPPEFTNLELKSVETLVAAGPVGEKPTPLHTIEEYTALLARQADQPLVYVFEHKEDPDGPASRTYELTLPPAHFVDFGFRLTGEPISSIQADSPAERAGFRVGDRITKVNGRDDFDPMRLPSECFKNAGKPMTFEVERQTSQGPVSVTLTASPDDTPPWMELVGPQEPLDVPGLGLCYPIRPRIQAIRPDSPAARAGLKPGEVITSVGLPPRAKPGAAKKQDKAAKDDKAAQPGKAEDLIKLDESTQNWISLFYALQFRSIGPVSFVVNNGSNPIAITPEIDKSWPFPRRGLVFIPLERKIPPQGVLASMQRGLNDTIENIQSIYAMIRSLFQRRVGPKSMAGPVGIVNIAYHAASNGLTTLIYFLGLISINLAVINFLPIPPLDGGQMAFLAAEKIRGKPLPDSALVPAMYTGILLILCLFLFVTYQDVFRLIGDWTGAH